MTASDDTWRPAANPWLIAIVVTMVAFMEILDTTIVNVALTHIAGDLSSSNDDATWTLTSYLVANGIVLPISGWFGSLFGRKRYFLVCIAAFTLFSFLCGIANSLGELIIFRLLQGFFGGGLQPNQQSIILDTFEPSKRATAFAVTAVATIVAPVLGPTLGGWITDNYSWRWIFFVNVPVGIATFFAVAALVEDPPWTKRQEAREAKRPIDFPGLALIAIGFGCLQVMMDRGEDDDWFGSRFIIIMAILAFLGLAGACVWLWYAKDPVVDIHVFRDRNFSVGCVMIFAMAVVLYSSAVVIPELAQTVLGYTALLAGLLLSPGALVVVVLIPIVGRVIPLIQTRVVIAFGFLSIGLSLIYSHGLTPDINFDTLVLMRASQTFGLAFLFVPISTIAYSTLRKEVNADAAALFTMFRNLAGSIGISAATALLTQRTQVRQAYLTEHLSNLDAGYKALVARTSEALRTLGYAPSTIHAKAVGQVYQTLHSQASLLAYTDIFGYSAILALCIVPLCFLFDPSKAGGGGAAPAH